MPNPGRNDPCPCGSGKKYKQCCLQRASPQRAEAALTPAQIPNAMQFAQELHQNGLLSQANALYQQILQLAPNHPEALHFLGLLTYQMGEVDRAVGYLEKALSIKPDYADAHNNLGNLFQAQGRLDEAVACYRKALSFRADYADAHNNLGNALQAQGKFDEAVNCYHKALSFKADYADAYNNLGNACRGQGRLDEAVDCFHKALSLKPNYANAYYNLGNVYQGQDKLDEAIDYFRKALSLKPDYVNARYNLGNALQDQGKLDEALDCYRKVLAAKPDFAKAHYNKLLSSHYVSIPSLSALFAEHLKFAEQCETPLKASWRPHPNVRDPEKRLKVGYVSADFRMHPVAYFIEPIIASHDKSRVEIYCYYHHNQHDDFTDRIMAAADHWVPCLEMSDDQLAERIRADGIDILVDLAGHTGDNRLLVFARKPAPVQVTYLGYIDTTGLSAMDYRLTHIDTDPPSNDAYYSETLYRLPSKFWWCYKPRPGMPEAILPPAIANGFVTFGSTNVFSKLSPDTIAVWADILRALPDSRLMMAGIPEGAAQKSIAERFAAHGIDPNRLALYGMLPPPQFWELHQQIDIVLDPFPHNGGTTTCDALWLGAPVVALTGQAFVSRMGYALLKNIGLPELAAESREAYVNIAVGLASDMARLEALRAGMRARLSASSLMDESGFTRNLETAYHDMWEKWCGNHV